MVISEEVKLRVSGKDMFSRTFLFGDNQQVCVVLYSTDISERKFLRVQYGCIYATVFSSQDCDCSQQIDRAVEKIVMEGGIFIYFRDHEAFGQGLFEKARIMNQEKKDRSSQDSILMDLHSSKFRHSVLNYVPEILSVINLSSNIILLSKNNEKSQILIKLVPEIKEVCSIEIDRRNISRFGRHEVDWKNGFYEES